MKAVGSIGKAVLLVLVGFVSTSISAQEVVLKQRERISQAETRLQNPEK